MSMFKCLSLNDSIRMEKENSPSFSRWKKHFKFLCLRRESPTPRKDISFSTPRSASPASSYYELCMNTPPDFYETPSTSKKFQLNELFEKEDTSLLGFRTPWQQITCRPQPQSDAFMSSRLSTIFEESGASDRDAPSDDENTSPNGRRHSNNSTRAESHARIPAANRSNEAHTPQTDNSSSRSHEPKKSDISDPGVDDVLQRFEFEPSLSCEADNEESNGAGSCWSKISVMCEASTRKTEGDDSATKAKTSLNVKELKSLMSEKVEAILSMEYDFLRAINSGIDRYCEPMRRWAIPEKQLSSLFQNIEEVANTSATMLEQILNDSKCLASRAAAEQSAASFSALTKIYRSKMLFLGELHQTYGEGLGRANELLDELLLKKDFAAFVEARAATSQDHDSILSLREFINMPRQYFLKLSSHFVDVSLAMPTDHPQFSLLQETVDLQWETFLALMHPAKTTSQRRTTGDRSPRIFAYIRV